MCELEEYTEICDVFPDYLILAASKDLIPWFADIANYLASDVVPSDFTFNQEKCS